MAKETVRVEIWCLIESLTTAILCFIISTTDFTFYDEDSCPIHPSMLPPSCGTQDAMGMQS